MFFYLGSRHAQIDNADEMRIKIFQIHNNVQKLETMGFVLKTPIETFGKLLVNAALCR